MGKVAKHLLNRVDGSKIEFASEAALMDYLARHKDPFTVEEAAVEPAPVSNWSEEALGTGEGDINQASAE